MAFASHAELISTIGIAALARRISELSGVDVTQKAVGQWRIRNSIPAPYFSLVQDAAAAAGVEGVTVDLLAELVDLRRRATVAQGKDAAE